MKGHVEQLAAEHSHVEHVVFYDAPAAADVVGPDYHFEVFGPDQIVSAAKG